MLILAHSARVNKQVYLRLGELFEAYCVSKTIGALLAPWSYQESHWKPKGQKSPQAVRALEVMLNSWYR